MQSVSQPVSQSISVQLIFLTIICRPLGFVRDTCAGLFPIFHFSERERDLCGVENSASGVASKVAKYERSTEVWAVHKSVERLSS